MGKYDVDAEEDEIRKVLAGKAKLDDIVKETQAVETEDSISGLLARIMASAAAPAPRPQEDTASTATSLYSSQVAFLTDALEEACKTPEAPATAGGVGWRDYGAQRIVELIPPPDLRQRLEVLPQNQTGDDCGCSSRFTVVIQAIFSVLSRSSSAADASALRSSNSRVYSRDRACPARRDRAWRAHAGPCQCCVVILVRFVTIGVLILAACRLPGMVRLCRGSSAWREKARLLRAGWRGTPAGSASRPG